MSSDNKYSDSVSICKGIGIILMVLGHSGFSAYGSKIIYLFHMPLFMILSGYCLSDKYFDNVIGFLKSRVKRLYLPFVYWSLIFLLLHNVFLYLHVYDPNFGYLGVGTNSYSLKETAYWASSILFRMNGDEPLLGAYWFLRTLFVGSILSFFLLLLCKRRVGLAILTAVVLSIIFSFFGWKVPRYFRIGIMEVYCSVFYLIGYWYRRANLHFENNYGILLISAVLLILSSIYLPLSYPDVTASTLIPYVIIASAGTLIVAFISDIVKRSKYFSKVLSYVGNNTFIILTLHFLAFKLISLLYIMSHGIGFEHLAEFPIIDETKGSFWWIAYVFAGVCIPLIFQGIYNYLKRHVGCGRQISVS